MPSSSADRVLRTIVSPSTAAAGSAGPKSLIGCPAGGACLAREWDRPPRGAGAGCRGRKGHQSGIPTRASTISRAMGQMAMMTPVMVPPHFLSRPRPAGSGWVLLTLPPRAWINVLSAVPGRVLAHFLVVLGEVALYPVYVLFGQVNPTSGALHHVSRGHDAPGDGADLPLDDVRDQQLVRGEIVLVLAVVPDVRIPVFRVGPVLGAGPYPDPLLRRAAVPFAVAVGQRVILEG